MERVKRIVGFCRRHPAAHGIMKHEYLEWFMEIPLLLLGLVDHYPVTIQQGQLLFTLFIGLNLAEYAGMNNTS